MEVFETIGSVIFGLAVAGCVISCLQVWNLTKKVEKLEKKVNKQSKKGEK